MRPIRPLAKRTALALASCTIVVAACDDGAAGDTEEFCDLVGQNAAALRAVPATAADVEALIDLYNEVGAVAPLAIEPDWSAIALNVETAWSSDDEQEILARMYATEPSAVAVTEWLQTNCGLDFGPVATIVGEAVTGGSIAETSIPG